jgi:hypothetical protein
VIIDNGSALNVISTENMEKLNLQKGKIIIHIKLVEAMTNILLWSNIVVYCHFLWEVIFKMKFEVIYI